jgi:primosomal protein N'
MSENVFECPECSEFAMELDNDQQCGVCSYCGYQASIEELDDLDVLL